MIRERVRSGLGLNGKLAALSDSYQKTRERFSKNLDRTTSPSTSNLTATGQMLKGIVGEAAGTVIRIFIKGKRSKELDGSKSKLTNNQVREFAEKDRPFFELTKQERQVILNQAKEIIADEIRKSFR